MTVVGGWHCVLAITALACTMTMVALPCKEAASLNLKERWGCNQAGVTFWWGLLGTL